MSAACMANSFRPLAKYLFIPVLILNMVWTRCSYPDVAVLGRRTGEV